MSLTWTTITRVVRFRDDSCHTLADECEQPRNESDSYEAAQIHSGEEGIIEAVLVRDDSRHTQEWVTWTYMNESCHEIWVVHGSSDSFRRGGDDMGQCSFVTIHVTHKNESCKHTWMSHDMNLRGTRQLRCIRGRSWWWGSARSWRFTSHTRISQVNIHEWVITWIWVVRSTLGSSSGGGDDMGQCSFVTIHVTHKNESGEHTWMSHDMNESELPRTIWMSHGTLMNLFEWVIAHIWISHRTHMDASELPRTIWMSHGTHMNWIWMSHGKHMN